jgi:hypothetical protein
MPYYSYEKVKMAFLVIFYSFTVIVFMISFSNLLNNKETVNSGDIAE